MKKQTPPLFLFFLWFLVGILLGYYAGSEYGFTKYLQTPYSNQETTYSSCNALTKLTPVRGATITSPLTVSITIDNTKSCKWHVFEAQAGTIELQDSAGQTLGRGILKTSDNWMTDQPVTYTGTLSFTKPETHNLKLIIHEEDPSGKGGQTVTVPLMD